MRSCARHLAVRSTLLLVMAAGEGRAQVGFQEDVIPTAAGDLTITFIGHGTLMFRFDGRVVHADPFGRLADYSALPKADLIVVTHEHRDHLDPAAIAAIRTQETVLVYSRSCAGRLDDAIVMENGEARAEVGVLIEAVPAYNLVHMREGGQPYHRKGDGNGYVLTFADVRVYVAGDTEGHPEMAALEDIDVAFLPMNLPYTMSPEMVAEAAEAFRPKVLYPYHYGGTEPGELVKLLAGVEGIEVRIREMR